MIEKLNPSHEPEPPAIEASPKCSCSCGCPCGCPSSDQASDQMSAYPSQQAADSSGTQNIHPGGS